MKKLIYLITIFIVPSCFGMFPGNLPIDIFDEILSWEKIDKSNPQIMAAQLIQNIKQYNYIPKTVSKSFYSYITESFNRLLERLNDEDFKKLNQYVSYSLGREELPQDFKLLVRLLKKLNKLNPTVSKKMDDALFKYALDNKLEDVRELIKSGASVNAKGSYGITALMQASISGYTDIAKLLINNNADVNAKDNDGNTALIEASRNGHTDILNLLIDNNADVNAKNDNGNTALMVAKNHGYTDIVNLIEAKIKEEQSKAPRQSRAPRSCSVM